MGEVTKSIKTIAEQISPTREVGLTKSILRTILTETYADVIKQATNEISAERDHILERILSLDPAAGDDIGAIVESIKSFGVRSKRNGQLADFLAKTLKGNTALWEDEECLYVEYETRYSRVTFESSEDCKVAVETSGLSPSGSGSGFTLSKSIKGKSTERIGKPDSCLMAFEEVCEYLQKEGINVDEKDNSLQKLYGENDDTHYEVDLHSHPAK